MAVTVKYIDNRLTTGSNDGTSAANAYRSLEAFRAGSGSGTIDVVSFVAGSGPYREVASSVKTALRTDISFDAATKTITTVAGNFTTNGFQTGDIIRVMGSVSNDRQLTVGTVGTTTMTVNSTNALIDEAAGASINIAAITRGSNLAILDPGGNGTAARPRRWLFNGVEIDGGVTLNAANGYTWTRSAANSDEWYVKRSDGSNPSLIQPFCGLMDNVFINDSADLDPDMGTVGSLSGASPMGWGDNDSIGFNTVYVRSDENPGTRTIRVGQVYAGISTTWQYHSFEDGIFTLTTRDAAQSSSRGVGISNRSTTQWWIKRCLFKYMSMHAIEQGNTGFTLAESNLTYFTGHRGYSVSANGELTVVNAVDYGSHLFANYASGLTSSAKLTIRNSIGMWNEAGAIAKPSSSAVLVEDHNIWWPRFGASGSALGYTSTANWTTTDATDYPPSAATTISTQAANLAAGGIDPQFMNPATLDFRAMASQAKWSGKPVQFARDRDNRRFSPVHPSRGSYEFV
mgnify:CR=1 FL=1